MSSPLTHGGRDARKAFTLIELLTVIAIIGILAAITFGVAKGVQERAAISQARTELATLSAALESYKRQYGDYPQTGGMTLASVETTTTVTTAASQAGFFNALAGKLGPEMDPLKGGKVFVELSKFNLETSNLPDLSPANDTPVANAILDPWGRRYVYLYKVPDKSPPKTYTWKAPSYVLFSVGPDGYFEGTVPGDGVLTEAFKNAVSNSGVNTGKGNPDNIYAN